MHVLRTLTVTIMVSVSVQVNVRNLEFVMRPAVCIASFQVWYQDILCQVQISNLQNEDENTTFKLKTVTLKTRS